VQNTQQSPGLGLSVAPQPGHTNKRWQLSLGMSWLVSVAQVGQVTLARVMIIAHPSF
jgi:hypothetical protein